MKFSLNVCDCNFYTTMKLPCLHIFAARKVSDIDLFDESLCHMTWTASYYHRRQRIFLNKLEVGPSKATQLVVATKPTKTSNQNEKFWKGNKICVKIASLVSDVGGITREELNYFTI